MIHPSDPELRTIAVRDGQSAPVTCANCGCRLARDEGGFVHFNPLAGRDARGCLVACVDAVHDATGRPILVAV
jgi:hypothetical protein